MPVRQFMGTLLLFQLVTIAVAHDGPDPLTHWRFDAGSIKSSEASATVAARLGPAATLRGNWSHVPDEVGGALVGGASLTAESFLGIVIAAAELQDQPA